MSTPAIARRYGEALADVAMDRNLVDQIEGELRQFSGIVESSDELRRLFASPVVSLANKRKVLEALVARIHPGEYIANLLRTLLRNYRLQHVGEVLEQYKKVINERTGVVVATITTAEPVGREEQERLGSKLQRITGKKVQFEFNTDPSLIGGAVTRVGSLVYDGSVRTQLQEIKHRLKTGE